MELRVQGCQGIGGEGQTAKKERTAQKTLEISRRGAWGEENSLKPRRVLCAGEGWGWRVSISGPRSRLLYHFSEGHPTWLEGRPSG